MSGPMFYNFMPPPQQQIPQHLIQPHPMQQQQQQQQPQQLQQLQQPQIQKNIQLQQPQMPNINGLFPPPRPIHLTNMPRPIHILPPGWTEHCLTNGSKYYYNTVTKTSTYIFPTIPAIPFIPPPLPVSSTFNSNLSNIGDAWEEFKDEKTNKSYYYNKYTKQCVWEEPEELRVKKAREEAKKLGINIEKKKVEIQNDFPDDKNNNNNNKDVEEFLQQVEKITENDKNNNNNDNTINNNSDKTSHNNLNNKDNNINNNDTDNNMDQEKIKKKKKDKNEKKMIDYSHLSLKERVIIFKDLLMDKKINPKLKFNDINKIIQNESRYLALKTLGERKQAYSEYCTQYNNKINIEKKKQKKVARENFMKMLAACEKINSRTRWSEIAFPPKVNEKELNNIEDMKLYQDERFLAIEDDYERRDLFNDFIKELVRNEKEYNLKEREENKKKVFMILSELVEEDNKDNNEKNNDNSRSETPRPLIRGNTKFRDVEDILLKKIFLKDNIDRYDLLRWFEEYIIDIRSQEVIKKRKEKNELLEKEKLYIQTFKYNILKKLKARSINLFDSWEQTKTNESIIYDCNDVLNNLKEINKKLINNNKIGNYSENNNSDIIENDEIIHDKYLYDIYENILADIRKTFKHDRRKLYDLLDAVQYHIVPESAYEEFLKAITKNKNDIKDVKDIENAIVDKLKLLYKDNIHFFFYDILENEINKKKQEDDKIEKRLNEFELLLNDYYYRSDHLNTTYDTMKKKLYKRSGFYNLDNYEVIRKNFFHSYMEKLNNVFKECTKSRIEKEVEEKEGQEQEQEQEQEQQQNGEFQAEKKKEVQKEIHEQEELREKLQDKVEDPGRESKLTLNESNIISDTISHNEKIQKDYMNTKNHSNDSLDDNSNEKKKSKKVEKGKENKKNKKDDKKHTNNRSSTIGRSRSPIYRNSRNGVNSNYRSRSYSRSYSPSRSTRSYSSNKSKDRSRSRSRSFKKSKKKHKKDSKKDNKKKYRKSKRRSSTSKDRERKKSRKNSSYDKEGYDRENSIHNQNYRDYTNNTRKIDIRSPSSEVELGEVREE